MQAPSLSIIILNFNTKQVTLEAIESIAVNYASEVKKGDFELIVTDNGSSDGSLEAFREYKKKTSIKTFHVVDNGGNIGFGAGNNKGVPYAKGTYVLFLNSDTIVYKDTLRYMLDFMEKHQDVGAASCKLINKDGEIDFNCHRGFPTPWNAFCYFSGIEKLFPHSRFFAGYTQGWKDLATTHEVDVIEGAFMLMPRVIGEKVGWWDEDYFFYGEDIQFCYDIKKLEKKISYIGEMSIMHIGGLSSGIKKKSQHITKANVEGKRMIQKARFNAMKIFYKKNYKGVYPGWIQWLIFTVIDIMQFRMLSSLRVVE